MERLRPFGTTGAFGCKFPGADIFFLVADGGTSEVEAEVLSCVTFSLLAMDPVSGPLERLVLDSV